MSKNKFHNGVYDLLLTKSEVDYIEENNLINDQRGIVSEDNDWLVKQFGKYLKNKLSNIDSSNDKIEFINKLILENDNKFSMFRLTKINENHHDNINNLSSNHFIGEGMKKKLEVEYSSADKIEIIVPFISTKGVNHIEDMLDKYDTIKQVKILTTTFDGRSKFLDIENLLRISKKFKDRIDVKIENLLSKSNQRIHAKSYLFHRESGFGSVYIGSSNYSWAGIRDGKEFNVKLSEFSESEIFEQIKNKFDNIWNQENVISIHNNEVVKDMIDRRLKSQLEEYQKAISEKAVNHNIITTMKNDEKKLFPYQLEILNGILGRIDRGIRKHLIVMATGTGKTFTIASIFNELQKKEGKKLKLLFIAQSVEILDQARKVFSEVLKVDNYGDEFYASRKSILDIVNSNCAFTSIQTLNDEAKELLKKCSFDFVVFDEAHHVAAKSYSDVLSIVELHSKQMFGLTATAERSDGVNVKRFFHDDYAAELNLYEAIEKGLLSDFDYHFIDDKSIDLKNIDIADLDKLGKRLSDEKRNNFVNQIIEEKIGNKFDSSKVKAIMFCASKLHAIKLSESLNKKDLRSAHLVSGEKKSKSVKSRIEIIDDFRRGIINFICVVDIFNEGIDVPEVDKVFFLRPTGSKVLYLQQLGRGLRKKIDKRLEVFDFVNNVDLKVNKYFDPLIPFRELTNNFTVREFKKNINFIDEYLPGDSNFHISKMARNTLLEKLRSFSDSNLYKTIKEEYMGESYEDYYDFIKEHNVDIYEMYRSGKSFFNYDKTKNVLQNKLVFKYFMVLNHKSLLEGFLKIINLKRMLNNDLINKLFINTWWDKKVAGLKNNDEKILINDIFNPENRLALVELSFLIKYKLLNEKLIDSKITNEIESLTGAHFISTHIFTLMGWYDLRTKIKKSPGQTRGVQNTKDENHLETNDFFFKTSDKHKGEEEVDRENDKDSWFKHVDIYDPENKLLQWMAPDDWMYDDKKAVKKQIKFEKYAEKTYIFHSSKELEYKWVNNNSMNPVRVFAGIIDKTLERNKKLTKDKKISVSYLFKIK